MKSSHAPCHARRPWFPGLPLLLVGTLCCSPALAEEDGAEPPLLTLQQAVDAAIAFSPDLRASGERLEQARAQLRQAYGMLLPFVSVQGTYSRADQEISLNFGDFGDLFRLALMNCGLWDEQKYGPLPAMCSQAQAAPTGEEEEEDSNSGRVIQELNNFDASLTVGMSLVNLRTIPLIQNVYSGRELARLQGEFAREQLIFAVVQMYYGVSTAQAAVRLMESNVATALRHLELTEVRLKAGSALENERIRASLSVVQARNLLNNARAGLDFARSSLATIIGREDARFLVEEFPENPWAQTAPDGSEFEQLDGRLDLRMMEIGEEMAGRQVTDIWMRFVPSLQGIWNFSASSNKGFADRYTQWRAMITLNWSLFEGGMRLAEADAARARVRELAYQRQSARLKARTEVDGALHAIQTARNDLSAGEELVQLATANLELVQRQYRHGAAQQSVILDAELQQISTQIQLLQARLRLALAQSALAKALGLFGRHEMAR